jgi:N-acetyl-beta-hexosaminidase
MLQEACGLNSEMVSENADIRIYKSSDEKLGEEGYTLKVADNGVDLWSRTSNGAFYGCQTLLNLLYNSPDSSLHGVEIYDRPLSSFRGVHLYLPNKKLLPWFRRFIIFLAKYKINKLILEFDLKKSAINIENKFDDTLDKPEIEELIQYIKNHHIEIIQPENTNASNLANAKTPVVQVGSASAIEISDRGVLLKEDKEPNAKVDFYMEVAY